VNQKPFATTLHRHGSPLAENLTMISRTLDKVAAPTPGVDSPRGGQGSARPVGRQARPGWATGFTLLELMITLAVAAILGILAIPSFREFIQSNRLTTQVNNFVADLNLARSEAVKGRGRVTLCKSSDQATCTTTGGWEQGWIIFTDGGLVRTQDAIPGEITIRGNSPVQNRIFYDSSGVVRVSGRVIFCDDRINVFATDKGKARIIVISQPGRVRIEGGEDTTLTSCTP
jgi:type IV fimbrial biogenesis protein FimT